MRDLSVRAREWFDLHKEEMVEDVRRLAMLRSVSRADLAQPNAPYGEECRRVLDAALDIAKSMGFDTYDCDGHVGAAYFGDPKDFIAIVGHLDVVPEGDNWTYPPFAATRVGDFLIGRGVSDNKDAVVMGLYVMRMLKELGIKLKHGVCTLMGTAEETGMADMRYYVSKMGHPRLSLIPDGKYPVNWAQKGSMHAKLAIGLGEQLAEFKGGEVPNMVPPHAEALVKGIPMEALESAIHDERVSVSSENGIVRVTARGVASHAARPEEGESAIHTLSKALLDTGLFTGQSKRALTAIADISSDYYGNNVGIALEDPDTGKTTIVAGLAVTENGRVSVNIDSRRSILSDAEKDLAALKAYAVRMGFDIYDVRTTPRVYMPKDDERVQLMMNIYYELTGDDSPAYTTGGGTYARELNDALTCGLFFPKLEARPDGLPEGHGSAHSPDEYLYIPGLIDSAVIYACMIEALDKII